MSKAVNPKYETLGHLSVTLEDIKRFRQLDSKCPGHPEYRWTSGVETTTGPLGQGLATSVGMAIAARWFASTFNRPGYELFDYDVYALCGDGCMMEGISGEGASLAGHLKLANLCWIYDNNQITIEGNTALAYSDDVATRFMGYGWNVTRVGDANDLELLERAFRTFKNEKERPTLIIVDSHIAYGAPNKQDTSAAHGEPLGEQEVRLTKRHYGWPEDAKFLVPDGVREHFQAGMGARGQALRDAWMARFEEYKKQYPEIADLGYRMLRRELPEGWDRGLPAFAADPKGIATRDASGQVLNALAKNVPWLLGGSADLGPSCKTRLTFEGAGEFSAENFGGRNLHFGIREHAMGAILNGLSLSKIRPFGSGFLIFSDYGRAAIRLSALMEIPVIHIFTHDSIGVGEDGPDAPAGRASRLVACHPWTGHSAARRRQRSGGGLPLYHATAPPACGARAVAPGDADPGSQSVRARVGRCARRLRARRLTRRESRGDPHRLGKRSQSGRARSREAGHRRHPLESGLHAVLGDLRPPAAGIPG